MKKTIIAAMFASLSFTATANEITVQEVINAIDSSKWRVNPLDYGMTAMAFQQAEQDTVLAGFQHVAGINNFMHWDGLTKAHNRWVVSVNNDTIYSMATVNASEGFSVKIPDVGDRFLSMMVMDQNHTFASYTYGGGTFTWSADDIDTDFVVVGLRIGTDGTDADAKYVANNIQAKASIIAKADAPFTPAQPDIDRKQVAALREALVELERSGQVSTGDTVKYDIRDVSDWEAWTVAMAAQLGLTPDDTAMYHVFAGGNSEGRTCYEAHFPKIPAKEFFSLTLYDADKYLMSNEYNIISSLTPDFISNKDGSFDVIFGDFSCQSIAIERGVNFGFTPYDGWSGLLRAYTPDVEAYKVYPMPSLNKVTK